MNIYGVVYKDQGKIYYFNGKNLKIPNNVTVIVETNRGEQFGKVVKKVSSDEAGTIKEELKEIIRIATRKDYDQYLKNNKDVEEALVNAQNFSDELGLNMRFINGDMTFDRKQLLLNFYADDRVDFRELARKLASIYHTRIELRQVGARDKACITGGIGVCGKPLCCATFLNHMDSVTINMAKDQNLSLNPSKINGACGRLLCCLTYEEDNYIECSKGLPMVGDKISYQGKQGEVLSVDILRRRYKILVDDDVKEVIVDNEKRAEIRKNENKILDLCTGNGVIPTILSWKTNKKIVGIELQKDIYDLAVLSLKENNLEDKITYICDDIKNVGNYFKEESFDVILCNPPYFPYHSDKHVNQNDLKKIARHEIFIDLKSILEIASKMLHTKGRFYLVHIPERLDEILFLAHQYNLAAKEIQLIYSKEGEDAVMVLISFMKDGKFGVKVREGINISKLTTYQNLFRKTLIIKTR